MWSCLYFVPSFIFQMFHSHKYYFFPISISQSEISFRSEGFKAQASYKLGYLLRSLSSSEIITRTFKQVQSRENHKQLVENYHKFQYFANSFSTKQVCQKSATMKPDFERLPKSVSPSHYELQLQPDLINFTFAGTSQTTIKVSKNEMNLQNFAAFHHLQSRRKMKIHVQTFIRQNNKQKKFNIYVCIADVIVLNFITLYLTLKIITL